VIIKWSRLHMLHFKTGNIWSLLNKRNFKYIVTVQVPQVPHQHTREQKSGPKKKSKIPLTWIHHLLTHLLVQFYLPHNEVWGSVNVFCPILSCKWRRLLKSPLKLTPTPANLYHNCLLYITLTVTFPSFSWIMFPHFDILSFQCFNMLSLGILPLPV
jgi:hypothetical protein